MSQPTNGVVIAPLGARFGAAVIDRLGPALIVGGYTWLRQMGITGWLIYTVAAGLLLFGWVMGQWWAYATRRAGLGYRLFRLELVGLADGKPIGWGRMCLRTLISYALWALVIPGIVMVIFLVVQERRQGWHDLAVRSLAIARRRTQAAAATVGQQATGRRGNSTVGLPPHLMNNSFNAQPEAVPAAPIDHVPLTGVGYQSPAAVTPSSGFAPPAEREYGQPVPEPVRQEQPPAWQAQQAQQAPWQGQQPPRQEPQAPWQGQQAPQQEAPAPWQGQQGAQPEPQLPWQGQQAPWQGQQAPWQATTQQPSPAGPPVQPAAGYPAPQPPSPTGQATPPPAVFPGQQPGYGVPASPGGSPQAWQPAAAQPTGPITEVPGFGQPSPVPPPTQPVVPAPGTPAQTETTPPLRIKPRAVPSDEVDGTRLVANPSRSARPATEGWHFRLDDGRDINVHGLVLIGRSPEARDDEAGATLIAAGEPGRTVSKTHLALGVDQRGLYVVDRGSTNGTALLKSQGDLEPCPANVEVRVVEGQVVSFGERQLQVLRYPAGRD